MRIIKITKNIELKGIKCEPLIKFEKVFDVRKIICVFDTVYEPHFMFYFQTSNRCFFLSQKRKTQVDDMLYSLHLATVNDKNFAFCDDFKLWREKDSTSWQEIKDQIKTFKEEVEKENEEP